MEYRAITSDLVQSEGKISGYAALFNTDSVVLRDYWGDEFVERIAETAFDKALARPDDVRCLFDHDTSKVLGRNTNNTLTLRKDEKGLYFECDFNPNIQWHNDLIEQIKRGDINQCSFAFDIESKEIQIFEEGNKRRYEQTVTDLRLFDVSVVTFPAYEKTSVEARSREFRKEFKEENTCNAYENELEIWEQELKLI